MANALFDKYRQACLSSSGAGLSAAVDVATDTIKAALVRGYTPALTTHQFLSDVTGAGGSIVGTAQTLGSKTTAAGVLDAADVTYTAVASGAAVPYILIYKDTGTATTSPVMALIDTATNLPVTPNGGDITIVFDSGSNRIFKL